MCKCEQSGTRVSSRPGHPLLRRAATVCPRRSRAAASCWRTLFSDGCADPSPFGAKVLSSDGNLAYGLWPTPAAFRRPFRPASS